MPRGPRVHVLTSVDYDAQTVVCQKCGPQRLVLTKKYAACPVGRREQRSAPGTRTLLRGYVLVTQDDGTRRPEHCLVMEQLIGRRLLPHETVHHKNGNRSDNHAVNLELWSSRQPAGQRVEDKLAYAREIIALYGDLRFTQPDSK